MKTLLQPNKTIYKMRKVRLVINTILGTSILIFFSSFFYNDSDYQFVNPLLKESVKNYPDKSISLIASRDNRYIIGMITEMRDSVSPEERNYKWPLYEITKDSVFNKIFNESEYNYMISQEDTASWDFSKITVPNISKYAKSKKTDRQLKLFISKPIFTKDKKYALVGFGEETFFCVIVYRKSKGEWIKYKTISNMMS